MKRFGIALFAAGIASFSHAADLPTLPTTKAPEAEKSKPPRFSSLWSYLKSSVRDCPLSVGPLTRCFFELQRGCTDIARQHHH
jgi:hypothetical protein